MKIKINKLLNLELNNTDSTRILRDSKNNL